MEQPSGMSETFGRIFTKSKNLIGKAEASFCLFSCEKRGFFGSMIRLTIFLAKLFVVLPILGGTLRFHKYFIVDKNAEKWCQFLKSKICKNCKDNSSTSNISGNESSTLGETISG